MGTYYCANFAPIQWMEYCPYYSCVQIMCFRSYPPVFVFIIISINNKNIVVPSASSIVDTTVLIQSSNERDYDYNGSRSMLLATRSILQATCSILVEPVQHQCVRQFRRPHDTILLQLLPRIRPVLQGYGSRRTILRLRRFAFAFDYQY